LSAPHDERTRQGWQESRFLRQKSAR
jgi:hypothetical protein